MSTLREEFLTKKQKKQEMINEASEKWVEKNIIYIHEKIDRNTVKKLTTKITKFDQVFGPYKDKIPAIGHQIEDAEDKLTKVVTGRAGDKKASDFLSQLSFLYSLYSSFFMSDLKVLIKTPLFAAAQKNPDVKLNVLDDPAHKAPIIRDAFKNAILPSKEEEKILKRIYRGQRPLIDANAVANQLLNLSYNELLDLTNIGKVPMVDTNPDELKDLQENAYFLNEKINKDKMQQVVNSIQQISGRLNFDGLKDVKEKVDNLVRDARREVISGKWDLPGRKTAAKQLIMFYNVVDKMADMWPTVAQSFTEEDLNQQDINDVRSALTNAAKDNVFQRLTNAIGTDHYPGLDPKSLANAIAASLDEFSTVQDVSSFFDASKSLPDTNTSGEPVEGPASASSPKEPKQPNSPEESESSKKTTTKDLFGPIPADKLSSLLQNLKDNGLNVEDPESEQELQKFAKLINDAGLKIVD